MEKDLSLKDVNQLLRRNLDLIEEKLPETINDYRKLFNYFIGDKFEGIAPERLKVCDYANDQKIDFYVAEDDCFIAYQCKLGNFEDLESVPNYDNTVVNEIEDIYTFLTDDKGIVKANKCSQEARNVYRSKKLLFDKLNQDLEPKPKFKIILSLAIFGQLTDIANEKLEELKNGISNKELDVDFNIIDYKDIEKELTLSFFSLKDRPDKIKLEYFQDIFQHTNDWGYALVYAYKFKELFEKYGMSLFDLNVRYYLERSSINKQIRKTLNERKGRKNFHLLNNGITISCTSWEIPKPPSKPFFILHHPQIINGCQTVISIYRAATEFDEALKIQQFQDDCKVPVRIVLAKDEHLLDDIVTASNNQNKMSARNLRSNSSTQRVLQNKFDLLESRWFYERKDGEFDSLKLNQDRNSKFKAKNYEYKNNRYRKISNEDLAKTWLSFIGFSKDASENIKAFEFDDDSNLKNESSGKYEWLFEKRPCNTHWQAITLGPQVSFKEDNFEEQSPSPHQYLLSYFIYEFIKVRLPSPQENKNNCIDKLTSTGKINQSTSAEDLNKALMEDNEFVLNQILYNMKEVMVELFSTILNRKYGPINEESARKILKFKCFDDILHNPDFKGYHTCLSTMDQNEKMQNLLYSCSEFIKDAVRRWMSINKREYFSSQRRIRFLHTSKAVESFKGFLMESNKETKSFGYSWKKPDIEFFDCLPPLPEESKKEE